MPVTPQVPPPNSLLAALQAQGAFTDAYTLEHPAPVALAQWVAAFYSSRLFKLERGLIGLLLRRPASDAQARELGLAQREQFSAWQVKGRRAHEILLADLSGQTRSWLQVEALPGGATRLWFGSAVMPRPGSQPPRFGWGFRALLGFHRAYSRALLRAGARSLAP